MQIKPNSNSSNPYYLARLATHKIEPTLERLNELDWKEVAKVISNPGDYVHLRDTHLILQDEADKLAEAEKAEAEKQAGMNPVRRAVYKAVQKPVGDWWNKHFQKEPEPIPFVQYPLGGVDPWDN
jgi:hypothetical protein